MEPIIANDWLKDYGPLFDLFDEEMRDGQVTQNDYFNEFDLNNYYNASYKQADELSLVLSLEWMPNQLELNSAGSSSAPSPAASSSSTCSTSLPTCSSSTKSNNNNNILAPSTSMVQSCRPIQQLATPAAAPAPTTTLKTTNAPAAASITTIGGQAPLKRQAPSSHQGPITISPSAASFLAGSPVCIKTPARETAARVASPKPTTITIDSYNSCSSASSSPSLGSFPVKRRRKCLRTKGTSLLAQSGAAALKLITGSGKQPLLQLQHQQHSQQTPHNNNNNHHHPPLIFLSTRANLTTIDKAVRYCVKIEHAYSLS